MSITKPELVKYIIQRVENSNGSLSNFGREFNLVVTVVFSPLVSFP